MRKYELLIFLFLRLFVYMQTGKCQAAQNQLSSNGQYFGFSMTSQRNETGHWVTKLAVNKSAPQLPKNWKMDFKTSFDNVGLLQVFSLQATIAVPPSRPDGYDYFPGIGYYKLYWETPSNFDGALKMCSRDGSHLTIINSEAECRVLQIMFSQHQKAGASAFVGFHDQIKEGEYITIFGQPLNSTGFVKWGHGDPNNYGGNQNCGCLIRDSFLCDVGCEEKLAFFCEYDLSWVDV